MIIKTIGVLSCFMVLLSTLAFALPVQKEEKPWTKWTQKEAEKILNDSPWAKSQIDTDTSEMVYTPTSDPGLRSRERENDQSRLEKGASNQAMNVKYIVRFFSARPVRQALARMMELRQKLDPEMTNRLHSFAELKSTDSIILTLSVEASDQRYGGPVMQQVNSAITATLKNDSYLERNGKRLFLEEYVPPGKDGFGARFIFLRRMDEKPFIDSNQGDVRFHVKYPGDKGLKVERTFKVSEMMSNGELEY